MTSSCAAQLVADAEWLPHCYDSSGTLMAFVRVPRSRHSEVPFLTDRELQGSAKTLLPMADVAAAACANPAQLHFIVHTGFCCSTLLVNALDATRSAVGIKEPDILVNLLHRLGRGEDFAATGRLSLVLKLLARKFEDECAILVKPSCFATPVMPHIFAARLESRAVLLSSSLRSFLTAVAKRGIRGRSWGRQAYLSCLKFSPLKLGFGPQDTLEQTDLQVAGLAWLMRKSYIERMASQLGPDRTMLLDADEFLAEPEPALRSVCGLFQMAVDSKALGAIVDSSIFSRHSKEVGRRFGVDERVRELEQVRAVHGEEIETVAGWVESLSAQRGIKLSGLAVPLRMAS